MPRARLKVYLPVLNDGIRNMAMLIILLMFFIPLATATVVSLLFTRAFARILDAAPAR